MRRILLLGLLAMFVLACTPKQYEEMVKRGKESQAYSNNPLSTNPQPDVAKRGAYEAEQARILELQRAKEAEAFARWAHEEATKQLSATSEALQINPNDRRKLQAYQRAKKRFDQALRDWNEAKKKLEKLTPQGKAGI